MSITANALYKADCLMLLERLDPECATLVYLDPPWYTNLNWEFRANENNTSKKEKTRNSKDNDTLFGEYIDWLSQVLHHSYRITKNVGNIVVHTEPRINGYVRLIAEELFDEVTEIVLRRPRRPIRSNSPRDEHEVLLICRKSRDSVWNEPTRSLTNAEIKERFNQKDSRGYYAISDLTVPNNYPNKLRYEWHGFLPPEGKAWKFSLEIMEKLHSEGRIYVSSTAKRPSLKNYAPSEVIVGNVWDDIPLRILPSERTDLVAQQPIALLERVIKACSNEDELIIDPFCGAGTMIITAQTLGRKWIASDNLDAAYAISKGRLEAINLKPNEDYLCGEQSELEKYEIVHGSNTLLRASFPRQYWGQFFQNLPVAIEETIPYEFKEVKGSNPVSTIANTADEYAVAFLNVEGGRIFWGIRDKTRITVGVLLTDSQRDEVRKAIDNKLCQIQPPIAPSVWRIEFHKIYDENRTEIQDLFVVDLFVPPAPQSNILYGTGKGEVFVKTNSGKKKLSHVELQAEVLNRQTKK